MPTAFYITLTEMCVTRRQNPAFSGELVQVRKQFETSRKRFLSPLCKTYTYSPVCVCL